MVTHIFAGNPMCVSDIQDDLVSLLSPDDLREREEKYGTKTRSESLMDLRAAAATPPSQRRSRALEGLAEEEQEEEEEEEERYNRGGKTRWVHAHKLI